jgi:hypothetical protein
MKIIFCVPVFIILFAKKLLLFFVNLQLKSSVPLAIAISNKRKTGLLQFSVVMTSSLVTAQTSPNWSSLQSFSITVWCIKNNQIIVIPVTFTGSFSSEQSEVETDSFTAFGTDMPSALTGCRVKSWVVFCLNFDTSFIN